MSTVLYNWVKKLNLFTQKINFKSWNLFILLGRTKNKRKSGEVREDDDTLRTDETAWSCA